MKRKGFTLIELLAVVIVLAVIAVVSVPIVLDVIDDVKEEANKQTVYGIIDGAKLYYADAMLDKEKWQNIVDSKNIYDDIVVNGEKPSGGKLYINEDGKVSIYVEIGNTVYEKGFDDTELTEKEKDGDTGEDTIPPTVELGPNIEITQGEWISGESPKIEVEGEDIDQIKWCQGIDCDPNDGNTIIGSSGIIIPEDGKETQICVIVYDKAENASEKVCTEIMDIDTTAPEFSGIADITVNVGEEVDLSKDVVVKDVISGVDGTYSYEPKTIDTSVTGTTEVVYTVRDKAGNITRITRKVTVSAIAPTISYTAESGAINNNGWAKEDFSVTINVVDHTGHGLKEFRVCTAITDTCDPVNGSVIINATEATRDIVIESNNNRICVQATDNDNKTSEIVCSDAYKLDKTKPTAGTIKVNGSSTITDWYAENVTIEAVDGSDALSGHLSTISDITSITESTTEEGKVVTITTTDLAGNTATNEYTIKVDKATPNCTFTTLSYVGENKTATIELTCTNSISGVTDTTLSSTDFTLSNSNISITNISKSTVTNGYKYTITIKGVTSGISTITLPANKVTTKAGLGNTAKTSSNITVTSVSLASTSGTLYNGGSNKTVTITSSNAGTLNCTSSNTSYATCSVSGTKLTISPGSAAGTATLTITGTNGNPTATYSAKNVIPSVSLNSTSGTLYVGGSNKKITITKTNAGEITCTSSKDSVATCSVSGTTLTVTPVSAGTATITVKEANGNKTAKYTATVKSTSISLSETSGLVYANESKTVTISGSNYGTLTCKSSNDNYATCTVSGSTLTINGVAAGTATITVKEANGNKTVKYTATIESARVEISCSSYYYMPSSLGICSSSSEKVKVNSTIKQCLGIADSEAQSTASSCGMGGGGNYCTTAGQLAFENEYSECCEENICDREVKLSSTSGTIDVGGDYKSITITGDGTFTCKSSNTNIATCTVSEKTLKVTSGKTVGTATITVTNSTTGISATYTVTTKLKSLTDISSITINKDSDDRKIEVVPEGTTCTSSNKSIVTCSINKYNHSASDGRQENYYVLEIAGGSVIGTTTITLKPPSGSLYDTKIITITNVESLTTAQRETLRDYHLDNIAGYDCYFQCSGNGNQCYSQCMSSASSSIPY